MDRISRRQVVRGAAGAAASTIVLGAPSIHAQKDQQTLRKLLRKHGFAPKLAVKTSCAPVPPHSGLCAWTCRHEQGLRPNNRAENSHQAVGKCPGTTLMPRVRR